MQICDLILISMFPFPPNIIVDCEWRDWEIGECSKTCGGGQRLNIRNRKIEAANGGKDCLGGSTETVGCYEGDCPGKLFYP